MGGIDGEIFGLQAAYDAGAGAFNAAHAALTAAWADQSDHSARAKAMRRPLYDARMAAGHAWNPAKKAYAALMGARKAIVAELRNINLELDL